MITLCLLHQRQEEVDQWVYLAWAFGIAKAEIFTWGPTSPKATPLLNMDELPGHSIVLVQPITGVNVQGVTSLDGFTHPDDAIYVFGGSDFNMLPSTLLPRTPDHLVYIPAVDDMEMHAPAAGSVVLNDRRVKRGAFG